MSDTTVELIDAPGDPFVAGTSFDLGGVDYRQAEYLLAGTARSFCLDGTRKAVADGEALFATRLLVYRPIDDAAFNGTVWVEWLNVSAGLDTAPAWLSIHTELIRSGAAWVGVSAQKVGVEGGIGLLGLGGLGLTEVDAGRYGGLHHPGDRFSYDIFTQASTVARQGSGTILDGLAVQRVLAVGESQSAFRLTTYVNRIDAGTAVHDGFMVHARGSVEAPIDVDGDLESFLEGVPAPFVDELRVPVLCVEAETDLITLDYVAARQDNADNLVVWEMAGTAHADIYQMAVGPSDTGSLAIEELARLWQPVDEVFGMAFDRPINAGPQHYICNAAAAQLDTWVRGGPRPPASPRLAVEDGAIAVDGRGIALGGIRTPHVDAPVSVLSGFGNGGHALSFLCGTTRLFDLEELRSLYRSKEAYLDQVRDSTEAAVAVGFVLNADAPEIMAVAAASTSF